MQNFLTTVISTSLDKIKRRITKVRVFGKDDIREAKEANAFGLDSSPIAGMKAVYLDTASKKESVIVGYINSDQLADVGEVRLYSKADGEIKMFLWLKNNGTMLLGGDADNAVRYSPLNSGLQNLVNQLQVELGKIATGIVAGGGTYTPGTLSLDVSQSKIDEIKTI